MPQFDGATFPSQLLWLVITFGVLFWFLRSVALPRVGGLLEERQERIRADLDKAAKLRDEAEQVRDAYEAALAEGRAEAQQVIRATAEAAAAEAAARQEEVTAKIVAEIDAAEQRIAAAREDALDNVRAVAAEAAQQATERLIGVKVDGAAASAAVDAAGKGDR